MRPDTIHTRLRKSFTSCTSLVLILVFVVLGLLTQRSASHKIPDRKIVEQSKKAAAENDFLLFEEDNETSEKSGSDGEWSKTFNFHLLFALLPSCADIGHFEHTASSFRHFCLSHPQPLFIRIHVLRI